VVGVAEPKGSIFGQSQDNFIWIPITTFQKLYGTRRSVQIQVEARSLSVFEQAQDEARLAMRIRHHLSYQEPDDFSIETGETVMDLWKSATQGIYIVTLVVTAISLLVGGVVVMNIMLVSVSERIKEIGIRKALGAAVVTSCASSWSSRCCCPRPAAPWACWGPRRSRWCWRGSSAT
jgi:putative ABC transport system permease protein